MRFALITKATIADDADPRVTPPAAAAVFVLDAYADHGKRVPVQSVTCRLRVLTAGGAFAAGGQAVLTLYVFDPQESGGGTWVRVETTKPIVNDQAFAIPLPAEQWEKQQCTLQVTSVTGTGADHVEVWWSPSGRASADANIAAGTEATAIRDGATVTTLATVKIVGGVNALEVDPATLLAGEDLVNNVLRVRSPATTDSTDAWLNYATAALSGTAGALIKSSAGRLRDVRATNKSATVQYWLLLVNKASAPVANDLPVDSIELPALTGVAIKADGGIDYGPDAKYFSAGIAWALSTTSDKVTLALAADAMVYARYA